MKIENRFSVKAPIGDVWEHLLDVERVAPCMPGAELTEVVDDRTYKGKISVKVGPVSLSFTGTVVKQERDDVAAHRVVLKADGREQRGKGAASATVVSLLGGPGRRHGREHRHRRDHHRRRGPVRPGDDPGHLARLTNQFADCLEESLSAPAAPVATEAAGVADAAASRGSGPAAGPAAGSAETPGSNPGPAPATKAASPPRPVAKPVKGFRLGLWAFWRAIVRFVQRLFGRGEQ